MDQKHILILTYDEMNIKKAKGTKQFAINKILNFNGYKNCLFQNEIILKPQQRFKSEGR